MTGSTSDWPLWEVFVRAKRGVNHVHAGTVHAPDAEPARSERPRPLHTPIEGVAWVVTSSEITASNPDDADLSSTRPPDKSSATPPTSNCPTKTRTCDDDIHHRPRHLRPPAGRTGIDPRPATAGGMTSTPEIEEDMALVDSPSTSSARRVGSTPTPAKLEGPDRRRQPAHGEGRYAYWREQHEFLNPLLVERPEEAFAQVIARQFLHDAATLPYWQAMTASTGRALVSTGR